MNILIISQYFYPEQFSITDVAFSLKEKGNKVTVLTGIPNYPMGKIIGNYKNWFSEENIQGVKIIRVPILLRKPGGIHMIMNYFSFAIVSSIRSLFLKEKYDVVYIYEVSPVTQILPGIIYRNLKNRKAKVSVNCQDIWPEVLKTNGFQKESVVFRFAYFISKWLYGKADKIIVSSPLFIKYLKEDLKLDKRKTSVLENFADDWVLNVSQNDDDCYVHFLFAGNLGLTQNLDLIINAVSQIKNKDKIKIDFVGDGSYMQKLKKDVEDLHLSNIILFHGRKMKNELKNFYDRADAFLLTLNCDNKVCYTIPSKLQGYMGAGKPVIASILGGAKDLIEESHCGIICDYNNPKAFAEAMDDFLEHKDKYTELGYNGRKYFNKFFRKDTYIDTLNKILEDD